ncbi:DMT family transporter [Stappia sp.]|uniref:DMT family transporter n=1 Tax=Stappia sp. TaxID=1870903 RepID=UPI0032D8DEB5
MTLTGEALAILSALFYGLAGVAIARGRARAQADNGLFLSVLTTAVFAAGVWGIVGEVPRLSEAEARWGLFWFALAGLLASVFARQALYRSTELAGAVTASLLRRLIPVFAVPVALVLLGQAARAEDLIGGGLVLLAVVWQAGAPAPVDRRYLLPGVLFGVACAALYALAYGLRALGLERLPDPAFGTAFGALVAIVWMLGGALLRADRRARCARLLADRGRWQVLAALSLSAGQTLQFFALQSAPVARVAFLGVLDTVFCALLAAVLLRGEGLCPRRLVPALALAIAGTALLVSPP